MSKISAINKDNNQQKNYLETVLVLNPKNEEALYLKILLNIEPNTKIDENGVNSAIARVNSSETSDMLNSLNFWIKQINNELDRQLNTEEIRSIKSSFYSSLKYRN